MTFDEVIAALRRDYDIYPHLSDIDFAVIMEDRLYDKSKLPRHELTARELNIIDTYLPILTENLE